MNTQKFATWKAHHSNRILKCCGFENVHLRIAITFIFSFSQFIFAVILTELKSLLICYFRIAPNVLINYFYYNCHSTCYDLLKIIAFINQISSWKLFPCGMILLAESGISISDVPPNSAIHRWWIMRKQSPKGGRGGVAKETKHVPETHV